MASKNEIQRQIALLQEQLARAPESPPTKKRRTNGGTVLAPATPSPRKKAAIRERAQSPTESTRRMQETKPKTRMDHTLSHMQRASSGNLQQKDQREPSAKSSFISQLKSINVRETDGDESVLRTEGFEEKPVQPPSIADAVDAPVRDDRLAIIENLELGPVEHKPIADDPKFNKIEPNSGIRLKERVLPHASLQDHLTGRYFLPPSLLYSVVRLLPNKQAYEVPVEGDWVTIAVVVERGDVKLTSGPGNSPQGRGMMDENENLLDEKDGKEKNRKRKKEEEDESTRKGGKKYVHLRLADLGHRSRSSTSSSYSTKGSLRGDAQLSLLLFESDYFDKLINRSGKVEKVQKLWRGGSGGAFEECFPRLREGTVIALLNPKVLKPFTNTKNPSSSSILALTPPSASAIAIIGYAADLGRCTALKRDGKPCGSWVDKRVIRPGTGSLKRAEDLCEYHVQSAVQRTRAGRAEFSAGTSGLTSTAHKRKPAYDPDRQWGLKPESGSRGPEGESTYVVGGLVASSGRAQILGDVGGTMGREEQARARRKAGAQEDKALTALLSKGSSDTMVAGGGGASREALVVVRKAREAALKPEKGHPHVSSPEANVYGNPKSFKKEDDGEQFFKKAYSVDMVKRLGFDPTVRMCGGRRAQSEPKKSDAMNGLSKLQCRDRRIRLGPPPGPKVRSGVTIPTTSAGRIAKAECDSDSDLEIEPPVSELL